MALTVISGSLSSNTVVNLSARPGAVRGYFLDNTANTATTYIQFLDAASTGAVTLGTTVPVISLGIPAGQAANLSIADNGWGPFDKGICIAQTTTPTGSTAPGSNATYNVAINSTS